MTAALFVAYTVLTGPIELIGAAEGHLDTLDPANVYFHAALRRAIDAIDEKRRPLARHRSTDKAPRRNFAQEVSRRG